MRDRTIEFWYDFPSPYCYLAAARIEALAATRDVHVTWRPFLLGPVFAARRPGAPPVQDAPPAEARYRRRDIERLCAAQGLPLRWPSRYPRGSVLASRVALVGEAAGWGAAFAGAVFRANFAEDRDIADPAVVRDVLAGIGVDPEEPLARAGSESVKAALRAAVDEAIGYGIFGAPSLVTADGELFWGNDRLEQALDWAAAPVRAAGDVSPGPGRV